MTRNPRARRDAQRSPDEIRAYLARLLGTAAFQASPRRRQLLAHVVDRMLAGQGDRLKAFDLALSVLGRDERFDPQNDPIVRIEVGRLRRDLERYYLAAGRDDPIRITIPKGHYVPAFEVRDQDAAPEPIAAAPPAWRLGWRRLLGWRGAVAAGLCALPLLVALAPWAPWRTDTRRRRSGRR
jgi:adenylate cyclase